MNLFPRPDETIEGTARTIRRGERSCVDVLRTCLARIDEGEPGVKAWVFVARESALSEARRCDEELAAGRCRGPLHGIPLGIKDIIDVEGLPAACGSRLWADRIADADAPLVARLREAGAVILGKTVTTQYAWIDPPETRNPWHPGRTPGGSSSGSAAAVATGMCLGAIGTQTGGSIIRPASFCGVAGFKPAHGTVSLGGILPFAPSLDHPGPIARSVGDLGILYEAVAGAGHEPFRYHRTHDGAVGPEDNPGGSFVPEAVRPPILGRLGGFFESRAEPEMRQAIERACQALAAAGASVRDLPLPGGFEEVHRRHRVIMASEAAAGHGARFRAHPDDYRPKIAELIEEGLALPAPEYVRARTYQAEQVEGMRTFFRAHRVGVLVTPATVGPAPDPSTTGDPAFNAPWSLTGSPTVSIPVGRSREGLPLGLQLVGEPGKEFSLFQAARWCEDVLRRANDPREEPCHGGR